MASKLNSDSFLSFEIPLGFTVTVTMVWGFYPEVNETSYHSPALPPPIAPALISSQTTINIWTFQHFKTSIVAFVAAELGACITVFMNDMNDHF